MDGVLWPVFLLIGAGLAAARLGLISQASTKPLSDVVFHLLVPALLFRSMARTDFHAL
ncbi:MAG: Membrane transport protein, partial [Pseudomonadota bacterium]